MNAIIVIIVCSVGKNLINADYFPLSKVNKLSHEIHKLIHGHIKLKI